MYFTLHPLPSILCTPTRSSFSLKIVPYLCFACFFPQNQAAHDHQQRKASRFEHKKGPILSCLAPNSDKSCPVCYVPLAFNKTILEYFKAACHIVCLQLKKTRWCHQLACFIVPKVRRHELLINDLSYDPSVYN